MRGCDALNAHQGVADVRDMTQMKRFLYFIRARGKHIVWTALLYKVVIARMGITMWKEVVIKMTM